MSVGMARAIEEGSKLSTLEGQSFEWKAVLTGNYGEPLYSDAEIATAILSGDGEFSRNGSTLTFETNDIIEIENTGDGVSDLTVETFTLYIRQNSTDYVVVPTVNMNVLLNWSQVLRITQITLEVNN